MLVSDFAVRCVTPAERFHFKAYYDIQPWDESGRHFLCMESAFQGRPPGAEDTLTVGMVDLESTEFTPLAETRAWNFQQGCMPHWLAGADAEIAYNDRVGDGFHAIALNRRTGERRVLPRPMQAMAPDGRTAASLNFARWGDWRPGYGYAGLPDPFEGVAEPEAESVYRMDLQTGECAPLVRLPDETAATIRLVPPDGFL